MMNMQRNKTAPQYVKSGVRGDDWYSLWAFSEAEIESFVAVAPPTTKQVAKINILERDEGAEMDIRRYAATVSFILRVVEK